MRSAHAARGRVVRRGGSLLLGAVTTLLLTGMLPAAPAGAGSAQAEPAGAIGVRLVEVPAATSDDPRARIYIVDHLAPGAVIERTIEVSNTTAADQEVALYSAAAAIDDGTFVGADDRTLNELASWTSVTPEATTLGAGSTTTAVVTIAVPADAAPGEQYAAVWAEARSAPRAEGGVVQVNRVGIRLYVSVGPGGAPAADFVIDSFTAQRTADGVPVVSASVHNTGGRALDMTGTLELRDGPGALTAGPFPVDLGTTLAIGDTQPVQISLDERLPNGPWRAVITLRSGLTERTADATITFPDSGVAAPVEVDTAGAGLPWALVVGAVALVLLVFAAAWVVRRTLVRRGRSFAPAAPR